MRILRYVQRNSAGDELREYWLATCRQDILAMRHAADCQCLSGVQPCAKIESCAITGESYTVELGDPQTNAEWRDIK